jgi:hypothetical protein
MIEMINIRILTNKRIFIQYSKNRKSEDAAFNDWKEFIDWLYQMTIGKNEQLSCH